MKKFICFILIFSIFFEENFFSYSKTFWGVGTLECFAVYDKENVNPLEETVNKDIEKSNEIVEKISKEIEEYDPPDVEDNAMPSKFEMAKNIAKFLVVNFVRDLKNYIVSYPLFFASNIVCAVIFYYLCCFLYKKCGVDLIYKFREFAIKHENLAIIAQNIYFLIPMTMVSFLYKYINVYFSK